MQCDYWAVLVCSFSNVFFSLMALSRQPKLLYVGDYIINTSFSYLVLSFLQHTTSSQEKFVSVHQITQF